MSIWILFRRCRSHFIKFEFGCPPPNHHADGVYLHIINIAHDSGRQRDFMANIMINNECAARYTYIMSKNNTHTHTEFKPLLWQLKFSLGQNCAFRLMYNIELNAKLKFQKL